MSLEKRNRFQAGVLLLLASAVPFGCQTGGAVRTSTSGVQSAERLAGVDPAKAFAPLARIPHAPEKPRRPTSLSALSAPATRQIAKAEKLVAQQRYTEAAIELERALRYDPNHPDIHRALANLHWQAGNLERARIHAARAIEGNPDDATAHYIDGRCRSVDGHHASAMTAYRTALLCSDFGLDVQTAALTHYYLARSLASEGYLEAALDQYVKFERRMAAIEGTPAQAELAAQTGAGNRSIRLARSSILEKLGRFEQAADVLVVVVDQAPEDVDLALRHARLLLLAGRLDDALSAARGVVSNDPAVIELLLEIHEAAGHPERAVDDVRARMADHPDNPALVLNLANTLDRLGRSADARRELTSFLEQHGEADRLRQRLIDLQIAAADWDGALHTCAEAVERDADRAEEFEKRISALASDPRAVERLLQPRDEKEPAMVAYLRGVLALAAGRKDRAQALLADAYASNPGAVPVRVAMARVLLGAHRYEDALRIAGRRDPDVPEHARLEAVLGDVYERLDDVSNAELHYKAGLQLNRSNTDAMFALAKLYNRSKRRLQAQRQLRVLLDVAPEYEAAREMLAFTYFEEGKPDVAVEQLEQLAQRAKSPMVAARCAALLAQAREPDPIAYRRALREAMEQHGADADTWLAIAESYGTNDDPEEKHEAYEKVLKLDPEREEAIVGLATTSQRLLAFEEAAQRIQSLLIRRPNRHQWRLGLIDLMWTLQDYDAALTLARTASERDELDEGWRKRFRLAILDTLSRAGRGDEVLSILEGWAAAEPKSEDWSRRLAREYVRQDQPKKAVAILDAAHRKDPENRELLGPLVDALVAAKMYDRASQHILDRLNDDPEHDGAVFRLARILAEAKRFDDAQELIRNRLFHTYERESYQDLLVGVLAQAKRYDESLDFVDALVDEVDILLRAEPGGRGNRPPEAADEEITRRPNEPYTADGLQLRLLALRQMLVGVLIMSKDYNSARHELTSWLETSRSPVERFEYFRRLAFCYRLLDNEDKANEILSHMILLQPEDTTLNNDIAYAWVDRGVRLEEAERMIRRSLALAPRQAAYLDTFGWLMYKKGEYAESKKWLTRAARARKERDPVIFDHLGDALWRLGESRAAIEQWRVAVEAAAENDGGDEERFISADERRVHDLTPKKIEDAGANRPPAVAPVPDDLASKSDTIKEEG